MRFFWTDKKRDALQSSEWSKGELKRRNLFARLVAAGKLSLAHCVREAIDLTEDGLKAKPRPEAWEEAEWNRYWSYDRLNAIAERWLVHPHVKELIEHNRKVFEAKKEMRRGLPLDVYTSIAADENAHPIARVHAAKALEAANEHKPSELKDVAAALRERARESMEGPAPAPADAEDEGANGSAPN